MSCRFLVCIGYLPHSSFRPLLTLLSFVLCKVPGRGNDKVLRAGKRKMEKVSKRNRREEKEATDLFASTDPFLKVSRSE